MTITGKGNYSGSRTEKFAITEKDISTVTMASADKVFKNSNGNHKITPKFIDSNGKALKAGVDYTTPVYTYADDTTLADGTPRSKGEEVQAADRLSVGTVVNVRIEGLGNYSGTLTESYRIIQKSIKSATVSVASQTYTGSEIKPSKSDIIVKIDGKQLSDDEYEITGYTNNTKVGTASLTIHATSNNYGGTKTVKFKITQIKMKK
jgi:hypothetical protein